MLTQFKKFLWRDQSDGLSPLRLGQRRIYILPTGSGLFFALALLVMLLTAINYNLALGYALVFLLSGLALTGLLHTFRNLYGLIISPGHCPPVFAGEKAGFHLHLSNPSGMPRSVLQLNATPIQTLHIDLPGKATVEVTLRIPSLHRGWLELPQVHLSSIYPLGFFVAWAYLRPSMRCLVYPSPIYSPLPFSSSGHGTNGNAQTAGQEDFSGFRDRQSTDSLHHVAWKASARQPENQALLLKVFSGTTESELRLDWQLTATNESNEQRISQLTGWVLAADALQACYGLRLPALEIPPGQGEAHRTRCLEQLALVEL